MHHWNQAVMLHAPTGFDPKLVERTLFSLVEHHDALRRVFRAEEGRIVEYNRELAEATFELEVGVWWRILLEDFATGYLQAQQGETIVLPDKTHSFQHWATRL